MAKRSEAAKKAGHVLPEGEHYALVAAVLLAIKAQGKDITAIPAFAAVEARGLL